MSNHAPTQRTTAIRAMAFQHGFLHCGFATSRRLDEEEDRLARFLIDGRHGEMGWLANHFEVRLNPDKLVPGARTVISLSYNYFNPEGQNSTEPKLSMYAYGRDYHKVVRKRLESLLSEIRQQYGDVQARVFVDSAPILEKKWAQLSGIGWMGKHTNLITPKSGSYFFLCEIVTDLECAPDMPFTQDHCGTCTRCIDACPTGAIDKPYQLDATRCISYLTIELKSAIPEHFKEMMAGWAFGCDICQQVCPWNRFSVRHSEPEFEPSPELQHMSAKDWKSLSETTFSQVFTGSAVKRAGYAGLMRNLRFVLPSAANDK
jgi:epoxyqueuosine reductase